jgi:membrane protein YdbS with pleckstrin-like domain
MQIRQSVKLVKLSYVVCLILAAGIGVYWYVEPMYRDYAKWAFILPALILLFTVIRHIQRRLVKLTVLDDRLRYEAGMVSKSTRTIELLKIQDVRVDQSLGQRMIGTGDLSMETAGGGSRITIESIDRPQEVADRILELAKGQRGDVKPQTAP